MRRISVRMNPRRERRGPDATWAGRNPTRVPPQRPYVHSFNLVSVPCSASHAALCPLTRHHSHATCRWQRSPGHERQKLMAAGSRARHPDNTGIQSERASVRETTKDRTRQDQYKMRIQHSHGFVGIWFRGAISASPSLPFSHALHRGSKRGLLRIGAVVFDSGCPSTELDPLISERSYSAVFRKPRSSQLRVENVSQRCGIRPGRTIASHML